MGAPALIVGFLGTVFMSFFMLTSGPELMEQLASSRGTGAHTAQLLVIVRSELARYLGCLTLINVGVALAVILLSAIMGLPNPFLWGVLAFGLNFIPYAGPAVMMATLFIASFNTFGSIAGACTVAAAYLGISTIDGQIVQPLLVGSRLALSPLIVFLALWFAGWLWGFLGIALAVPLLTILKATAVHLRPESRLAALLDSGAYPLRDRLRLQARTRVGTKPLGAS
jgi:predicted PurR-regulated permease PerM